MNPVHIDVQIDTLNHELPIELESNARMVGVEMNESIGGGGTRDYRKLVYKPSINGTELYQNYDEIDPTVPSWAKENHKPNYTAEEIGAVDEDAEMSLTTVKDIWDSIFQH